MNGDTLALGFSLNLDRNASQKALRFAAGMSVIHCSRRLRSSSDKGWSCLIYPQRLVQLQALPSSLRDAGFQPLRVPIAARPAQSAQLLQCKDSDGGYLLGPVRYFVKSNRVVSIVHDSLREVRSAGR